LDSVAEYSFTGTCTAPMDTVPFQIDRGIRLAYPLPPPAEASPGLAMKQR
jgi:hypothetical protein